MIGRPGLGACPGLGGFRPLRATGPLALVLAAGLALAACDDLPLVGGSTELRVENGSELDMSGIVVFLPEERLTADELPAGARTPYREVERAFRIATVDGVVEGEPFHLQVIDHVGEEPLGDGRFTYVLEVYAMDPPVVSLRLRRD